MEKYLKHFTNNEFDIQIAECGVEQYPGSSKHEYTVRRYYVLHYVESGVGFYEVNGKRYKLQANDGFILRKNDKVKYYSNPKNPWKYYWIAIQGEQIDEVLSKTTLLKEYVCHFEVNSESAQLIKEIVRFNQNNLNNDLTNLWNHSQLYAFLYQINLEFVNKVEITTANLSQNQLADFIIDYIYENYDQKILVQDIADEFNISRSYLYKICTKRFEKTPKEILLDLRLSDSKHLLLYTDLLVKEIADQVGFSNPLYFSKVFKATYGYSPSEYRQLKNDQLYY